MYIILNYLYILKYKLVNINFSNTPKYEITYSNISCCISYNNQTDNPVFCSSSTNPTIQPQLPNFFLQHLWGEVFFLPISNPCGELGEANLTFDLT